MSTAVRNPVARVAELASLATSVTDDVLLAGARSGNKNAIETLLERYQDRVFGFGLRLCGDSEDAKDIVQETLLAAALSIADFRADSSVSTWLYTIARSFCIKTRRRSKFAPDREVALDPAAGDVASATPGPDDLAARDELKHALTNALAALDPESREVIVLRDMEGLTAPEVAKVTGASVDAIKSRLHRARTSLRTTLAEAMGDALSDSAAARTKGFPRTHAPTLAHAPNCPDVLGAFSKQVEGDLEPRLCADLQRHVDGCAACRARCDSMKATLALCANLPAGPMPDAVRNSVRLALREALSPL